MDNKYLSIEASYYCKLDGDAAQCDLCPHKCLIVKGGTGICRSRTNIDGVLYTTNFNKVVALNIDPIEKKPLYHFYPGIEILSIGSNSCNLKCDFCQNYTISQMMCETTEVTPEDLLNLCSKHRVNSVAFTYTEPVTWFEYVLESAILLQRHNIKTIMVTNGYVNQEPLLELLQYIDAMNIDLKAMSDSFYKNLCSGTLQPVLETIKTAYKHTHLEVTNLLVPGENDSEEMIQELVSFLSKISVDIPLHISKYFPQFKRETKQTSIQSLLYAFDIAKRKLNHVYIGNVYTDKYRNTSCSKCGSLLIQRGLEDKPLNNIEEGKCPSCANQIYGKFY